MNTRIVAIFIFVFSLLTTSCRNTTSMGEANGEAVEVLAELADTTSDAKDRFDEMMEIIESWRADTTHREEMADSLSGILGFRVVCTDPVTHIYDGKGRRFHWNKTFGDILEIPNDWIPSVSIQGLYANYYGAAICSPDSTCWLNTSAWNSAAYVTENEFYEGIQEMYEKDSLVFHKGKPIFQKLPDGSKVRVHWAEGINKDGSRRRKDYWSVYRELEAPPVDYSIMMVLPVNTPINYKRKITSYYNTYPNNRSLF